MVARVARRETAGEWLGRAGTLTLTLLREEVEAATMLARVMGSRVVGGPLDEDTMEELREVERSALASLADDGGQMDGQMSGQMSGQMDSQMDSQMSGGTPGESPLPRISRRRLTMSLREDVARFWRIVEDLHRKHWPDASFVGFLCASVERAWRGVYTGSVAYQDVYLRDRYRCANPTCSRRDVTPHHIVFRAHGGGEERSNLISLCTVCHLELVHGGRLKVSGSAPRELHFHADSLREDRGGPNPATRLAARGYGR